MEGFHTLFFKGLGDSGFCLDAFFFAAFFVPFMFRIFGLFFLIMVGGICCDFVPGNEYNFGFYIMLLLRLQ